MIRTIVICLLIVALAIGLSSALWIFRQRPEQREVEPLRHSVEIEIARSIDVPVTIPSQGVIEARTLTIAASEVAGKVIEVMPTFEVGARFEAGDVLLRIDPSDYEAALAMARSSVAAARLALQVEEAKAEQSDRDWKRLGRSAEASPLVRRVPQLVSARADLDAALAELAKRERDLERTVLRAPYKGRILRTHTDLASFVGIGSPLADFYEDDILEVRLPVSLPDLEFLDLGFATLSEPGPMVKLSTSTGQAWEAEVVRKESEIDRRSRSLHLIAAIRVNPSVSEDPLLVPGLFVRAEITGRKLENVFRIPRRALHEEKSLILVKEDDTLSECPVSIIRKETDTVLVGSELNAGDRVCVSFLPVYEAGMEVNVLDGAVQED